MTLVKWQPAHSLVSDFDQMINSIFNDGWNDLTTKPVSYTHLTLPTILRV